MAGQVKRGRPQTKILYNCDYCRAPIYVHKAAFKLYNKHYCNNTCKGKAREGKPSIRRKEKIICSCKVCGTKIQLPPSKAIFFKYCSRKCFMNRATKIEEVKQNKVQELRNIWKMFKR